MNPKNGKTERVWIFQAVPEHYDILKEVPQRLRLGHKGDSWSVTRYGAGMQVGDLVLLWRAGPTAGVYGTGRIASQVYSKQGERRVDLEFAPLLEHPVLKSRLRQDPVLKDLHIVRSAQGTNFAVTDQQWAKLRHLIGARRSAGSEEAARVEEAVKPFDPKNQKDGRSRIMGSIVQRRGQAEFRRSVMQIFGGRCLITGCDAAAVLEAAHISPYLGDHTNNPTNGLLLRADLHTLFDLYLIAIDAKRQRVQIAPALQETCYAKLKDQVVKLPKPGPSRIALEKHRLEFLRRIKIGQEAP